jgi:hypothetical protein
MPDPYAMSMLMVGNPVLCACLAAFLSPAAAAWAEPGQALVQDHDQDAASQRRLRGSGMPVREIERRVVPRMPGAQYLGFDYDPGSEVYTLKFLRNGSVIWVDVDGRDGRILRRSGN